MSKVGIMGGTFDPIHVGHLMLAEWAADAACLDRVLFLPTGYSYMKNGRDILPGEERLRMVELAVWGNERLKGHDLEIRRSGYTYTYETLEQLKKLYPEDQFYFIEGADCLFAMETWKYPEKIFENCTVVAAVRGDVSMEQLEKKKQELNRIYGANILLLPFMQLSISSTEIRERIQAGLSVRYMIPDSVLTYIEGKGFYREKR